MSNVTMIKSSMDVAATLRSIADNIDSGEYSSDSCTIILGSDVFHAGCVSDQQAASDAVFNMTFGIHKLMKATE